MTNKAEITGTVSDVQRRTVGKNNTTLLTCVLHGTSGPEQWQKPVRLDVKAFGKVADAASDLANGDAVRMEGEITTDEWAKGDKTYYFTRLTAARIVKDGSAPKASNTGMTPEEEAEHGVPFGLLLACGLAMLGGAV